VRSNTTGHMIILSITRMMRPHVPCNGTLSLLRLDQNLFLPDRHRHLRQAMTPPSERMHFSVTTPLSVSISKL
jgi:hypothetical protein